MLEEHDDSSCPTKAGDFLLQVRRADKIKTRAWDDGSAHERIWGPNCKSQHLFSKKPGMVAHDCNPSIQGWGCTGGTDRWPGSSEASPPKQTVSFWCSERPCPKAAVWSIEGRSASSLASACAGTSIHRLKPREGRKEGCAWGKCICSP